MAENDDANQQEKPEHWDNNAVYGPSTVITALDQVEQLVATARGVPLSASVMVNRAEILDLVDQARKALPQDLVDADILIADADEVLARADSAADATITQANTQAKAAVDQAQDKAEEIVYQARTQAKNTVEQAEEQAQRTLEQARQEAEAIVHDANAQAERLVQSQRVVQLAQDTARQIVADAHAEEAKLKYGADSYASASLEEISKVLSDLQRRTNAGRRAIAERVGPNPPEMN